MLDCSIFSKTICCFLLLSICGRTLITDAAFQQLNSKLNEDQSGSFWQLTDVHWDLRYSETGDEHNMCHDSNNSSIGHNGFYGNYLCDAPWGLVYSSIKAMKKLEDRPNFVVWTGDNSPHVSDPKPDLEVIFKTLKNISTELRNSFPEDIPIIPVLGNHDTYPQNVYPFDNKEFYGGYLEKGGWNTFIQKEEWDNFKEGGYFQVHISSKLSVLSLNTILYFNYNRSWDADPSNQFKWLRERLSDAMQGGYKVLIAAHAPPGYWERFPMRALLNVTYNDIFVDIINEFGEVILGQIYGHTHTDSFRIFGTSHKDEDVKSVAFIAPSLTPWHSYSEGGTAINPSIRLYSYNSTIIKDYFQFHMNLSEVNRTLNYDPSCISDTSYDGAICEEKITNLWKLYYSAKKTYSLESLSVSEVLLWYKKLFQNETLFQIYALANSAGYYNGPCNTTCKRYHFCSITHLRANHIDHCLNKTIGSMVSSVNGRTFKPSSPLPWEKTSDSGKDYPHAVIAVSVSVVSLILIIGVMMVIVVVRRKKILGMRTPGSEFEWVNRHSGYRPLDVDGD